MTAAPSEALSALDTIIIGAGFAGLAAAEHLRTTRRRFLLLEATKRVGGRAYSRYRLGGGRPNELGAIMVHGRKAETHAWARRYGLTVRPFPVMQKSRLAYHGKVGRYPWFALPLHPVVGFRATVQGSRKIPRALLRYTGPDRALATLEDEWKVRGPARLLVELLHAHVYAADPDSIGVRGPAEEDHVAPEPYGYVNFQIPEGYSALAQRSASSLGDVIRFGRQVTHISRTDAGVRVRAISEGQEEEYVARSAVVTVPLGVLKSGAISFDPPLPEPKQRAIARIAFGDGYDLSMRVRGGTMRSRLGNFAMLWGGTPSSFYRPYVDLDASVEVLTAFTVGREARRRVGLSREEMVAATLAEWEGVVPEGVTVGTVEDSDVHPWSLDPWTRGTYSYLPPGASLADRRELGAPVGGRLFFAGEATEATGESATVSGAMASGRRAALEVLNVLQPTVPKVGS